jgi:hypothetical protein
MEKVKPLNRMLPLDYPSIKYLLDLGTEYKLKNHSGKPTGLMGANYLKLGNKEMDIVGFLKSDKFKGKMMLVYLVDHKQKHCTTFCPPVKLTRAQIEYAIGYAKDDKEAMNKAREFRKAIKNGIDFYKYRKDINEKKNI